MRANSGLLLIASSMLACTHAAFAGPHADDRHGVARRRHFRLSARRQHGQLGRHHRDRAGPGADIGRREDRYAGPGGSGVRPVPLAEQHRMRRRLRRCQRHVRRVRDRSAAPAKLRMAVTLNYGTNSACTGPGDPNEALAWVDHAVSTKAPVDYWTVGNEVYGAWETDLHTTPNDARHTRRRSRPATIRSSRRSTRTSRSASSSIRAGRRPGIRSCWRKQSTISSNCISTRRSPVPRATPICCNRRRRR